MAILDKFYEFANSPEGAAFASQLAVSSAPSMTGPVTFGGALGQAFQSAEQARDLERQREREQQMADLQKARFGLEQQRFGLQQRRMQQEMAQKEAQQEQLNRIMGGLLGFPQQGAFELQGGESLPEETGGGLLNGLNLTEQDRVNIGLLSQIDPKAAINYAVKANQPDQELERATRAQNQKSIQAIDSVIPVLNEIKEMDVPNQTSVGKLWSPAKQKSYESKIIEAAESISSGFGWPSTEGSLKKAMNMLERGWGESEKVYKQRIDNIINDLEYKKKLAERTSLKDIPKTSESNYSKSDLEYTAKKYGISVDEVKRRLGEQ